MARLLVTIDVPGNPKEVFDYLEDFANTAEWDPGVLEAERLDTGKIGVASRFRVAVSFFGASSTFTYRVTNHERPYRFRVEGTNGIVVSEDDVAITPVAGGVRVTYDANLRLPFYLRAIDPVLQAAFQWAGRASVAGMRETLIARARNTKQK
jgi:carbon monoxide dehydrogenase subunit G